MMPRPIDFCSVGLSMALVVDRDAALEVLGRYHARTYNGIPVRARAGMPRTMVVAVEGGGS